MGKDLIIDEKFGAIGEFQPERFRCDMAQIRSITDVALRDLKKDQASLAQDIQNMDLDPDTAEKMRIELRERHEAVLAKVAHFRAIHVMKAVAYWDQEVHPVGHNQWVSPQGDTQKTVAELEVELGFSAQTFAKWRELVAAGNYADKLILQWLRAAKIIEPDLKELTEGPTTVEKTMRLVRKMTPDEYDEFKMELLQFDRARRRPIAPIEVTK